MFGAVAAILPAIKEKSGPHRVIDPVPWANQLWDQLAFRRLIMCDKYCVWVRSVVSNTVNPWTVAHQAPLSMGFSRQEYWSGWHSLLQGILPTQGLNPGLLHCRQILYHSATSEAVITKCLCYFNKFKSIF